MSAILVSVALGAQDLYEQYIEKYADAAIEEMYRSGVPASITLAQGLLESGMGRSSLATTANNHFGIKCHGWTGGKVYYDDDEKGECFRKYDSVADSYRDHSDFLRYKDRYKSLFDLDITDYKGWCTGLKAAGYATDPGYAQKLINIIEKYDLNRYVTGDYETVATPAVEDVKRPEPKKESAEPKTDAAESKPAAKKPAASRKQSGRKDKTSSRSIPESTSEVSRSIPESPSTLEALKPADGFSFSLSRKVYDRNGVACVLAAEGETYASIASDYDLFQKEILKFNDLEAGRTLLPGEVVFIKAKKTQTVKGLDKHICDVDGETLWQLSQRYGVRLQSLCKYNSLEAGAVLHEGDEVLLRKQK